MRNYILILFIVSFAGCTSDQEELPTKKFIESVYMLEQKTNNSWQVDLNGGLSEENPYFHFMHENELALGFLQWNLIDEKIPDSIKFSTKSPEEVHKDFISFTQQDNDIITAIQLFIYPEKFKDKHQINIDSLVSLSSKLFFVTATEEGNVGWKLCAGKSKFPKIYGESKSYASVALQALCFQAVFEEKYSNPEKTVWSSFNQKIPEVSAEMNSIEYDNYIDKANQLMWAKMSESEELKDLLVGLTTNEHSKLYFKVIDE
ncbi:hypothetical protein [Marivirga sp.]|uniref:hypothetical protein n=1 Tax=Marivirga sp. TaxID=2018662 RepID=UPI003DA6E587